MLVIRLSRRGRRNLPMYRILVAEHSKPTDGKFVEMLGHYDPAALNQPLSVNKERVEYWMAQGAKPSNTVAKLLNRVGFDLPVVQKQKSSRLKEKEGVEAPMDKKKEAAAESPVKTPTEVADEPKMKLSDESPKVQERESKPVDQESEPEQPATPKKPPAIEEKAENSAATEPKPDTQS